LNTCVSPTVSTNFGFGSNESFQNVRRNAGLSRISERKTLEVVVTIQYSAVPVQYSFIVALQNARYAETDYAKHNNTFSCKNGSLTFPRMNCSGHV